MAAQAGRIEAHFALERDGFDFAVELSLSIRGITGIFGPSGAGKTTLLRCIAGLERCDRARLVVDGSPWDDGGAHRPAHQRAIGYVFQEPRLFPHMNVRSNLDYGRRRNRGVQGPDIDVVVGLLGLERVLDRRPNTLSCGEAQRVAIGRALLRGPRLLLMDEPVSALDAERRRDVLPFVEALHAELGTPILYVSHNIDEICLLCDQLVVMDAGSVVASGDLQSVIARTDLPVLGGDEACTVLRASTIDYDRGYDMTRLAVDGSGELWIAGEHKAAHAGLRVRIRANDVSIARQRATDTSILNALKVTIDHIDTDETHSVLLHLRCGNARLLSRITRKSLEQLGLSEGDTVVAQIKTASVQRASL